MIHIVLLSKNGCSLIYMYSSSTMDEWTYSMMHQYALDWHYLPERRRVILFGEKKKRNLQSFGPQNNSKE
jgi:hypothetical protein